MVMDNEYDKKRFVKETRKIKEQLQDKLDKRRKPDFKMIYFEEQKISIPEINPIPQPAIIPHRSPEVKLIVPQNPISRQ